MRLARGCLPVAVLLNFGVWALVAYAVFMGLTYCTFIPPLAFLEMPL